MAHYEDKYALTTTRLSRSEKYDEGNGTREIKTRRKTEAKAVSLYLVLYLER